MGRFDHTLARWEVTRNSGSSKQYRAHDKNVWEAKLSSRKFSMSWVEHLSFMATSFPNGPLQKKNTSP